MVLKDLKDKARALVQFVVLADDSCGYKGL